jgi:peptidoglycan/LPS O-acetylase OafA/YrhL
MKKAILILVVEFLISAVFAFSSNDNIINYDFFTALGLGNLIIGLIGGVVGLICLAINKETGKSFLIASGVLLLLGCLTCAVFPLQFNAPRPR